MGDSQGDRGPGYSRTPKTEAAPEAQRQQTLVTISEALDEYTGNDVGLDYDKWDDWLREEGNTRPSRPLALETSSDPSP